MTKQIKKTWGTLLHSLSLRNIFGKKKLFLAFEYGLALSEVARETKTELTPDIVERAEDILLDACTHGTAERVAVDMIPNILASFEPKEDNKSVVDPS